MSSLPGADQAADGELERLECLASWATALAERDPTWRGLHTEKQRGWASAALEYAAHAHACHTHAPWHRTRARGVRAAQHHAARAPPPTPAPRTAFPERNLCSRFVTPFS